MGWNYGHSDDSTREHSPYKCYPYARVASPQVSRQCRSVAGASSDKQKTRIRKVDSHPDVENTETFKSVRWAHAKQAGDWIGGPGSFELVCTSLFAVIKSSHKTNMHHIIWANHDWQKISAQGHLPSSWWNLYGAQTPGPRGFEMQTERPSFWRTWKRPVGLNR